MPDRSYAAVMARRSAIIEQATGVKYELFERGGLAFDYESVMASVGLTLEEVAYHVPLQPSTSVAVSSPLAVSSARTSFSAG